MAGLNDNLVTFSTDFTNTTPKQITQSPKHISTNENLQKKKEINLNQTLHTPPSLPDTTN